MKKMKTSRLLDNKTFCKIISVIGAIAIWATVTLTVKTDSERLLRNVPIDFSVAGTAVEALGLSSFDRSDENIDITLSGNRGSLNSVSKEDFVVSLSLGRVTKAGKYTVRVDVSLKEPVGNVSVVNYSPKTIQVSFDRSASKTLTVNTNISGMSAKDGFMLDKGYPSSQEVTIIGPESVVETVTSCVADVDSKKKVLEETLYVSDIPLVLYDENGNVVSDPFVVLDKEMVNVSVPVLKIKDLPVVTHFINMPSTFVESNFKYTLSHTEIRVAGPEETIDTMSQLDVRYADFKTIKPGDIVSLNVELPSGFVNVDNTNTIDVSIPSQNMTEKSFTVNQFNVIGIPDDKTVTVITRRLNNVVLMGNETLLNSISSNDIVVEINLSDTTLSSGTMTVPATITVPGKSGVFWAYGDYEVVIKSN